MSGIPTNEPVFQISIVSRMVGIHQQTIRQYERIGLIQPARSEGNTRLFSHEDVDRLRQVVRLVNDLGVNL
ncbi:MAG: MerR family transcriptional regulator, partial [Chloroflexi bacterium]|nr:MerR family transcriptional regulator [Chloroflexota bacterium]